MKRIKILLALPLILLLATCAYNAQVAQDAYDTLENAKAAYNASLTISAEFYKEGYISEGDKEEIIKVMKAYCNGHNASVIILGEYGKFSELEIDALRLKLPETYFEVEDEKDELDKVD